MGDDDGEIEGLESALICGYLQKLGRNGKWQARWFETDGECLTYYKSSKRVKLLATLDLAKVGSIVINTDDRSGTSFSISISDRPYRLRADSVGSCKDWVITLNRVKEARMHEGNVKLAKPTHHPPDLLDTYTPKVVVVANRQRTRAIDDDDIQSWENGAPWTNPANDSNNYAPPPSSRLARWQKPRNSLSRLARRLAKWARSIRKMGCVEAEDQVVLDPRLHPPGHDDKASMSGSKAGSIPEALSSDKSATAEKILRVPQDDEDDDIRHLS
jgi:PH domain